MDLAPENGRKQWRTGCGEAGHTRVEAGFREVALLRGRVFCLPSRNESIDNPAFFLY
jgi:hypothetical protein